MTDKHVSPAVGDFVLEERAQLLARVAELEFDRESLRIANDLAVSLSETIARQARLITRDDAMLRFARDALLACEGMVLPRNAAKRIEDYLNATE